MDQLIAPLPRGVPGRALIDHLTPLAQFADPADILADPSFVYEPSKVFLGVIGETFIGAHLDSHMLTVAGSRQGKTRCLGDRELNLGVRPHLGGQRVGVSQGVLEPRIVLIARMLQANVANGQPRGIVDHHAECAFIQRHSERQQP